MNRANNILGKLYDRSDYHNVVEELTSILNDAELLGVKGMLSKYFFPMDEMFGCLGHFHKIYYPMQLMNCLLLRKN